MLRKLLGRQPAPEPEEDEPYDAPAFGVSPMLDLLAMQYYLARQQRDIWRQFEKVWWRMRGLARAWALMSLCWLFIAVVQMLHVFVFSHYH